MRSLYIASTEGSGGKTTLSVGLAWRCAPAASTSRYFKPVGIMPQRRRRRARRRRRRASWPTCSASTCRSPTSARSCSTRARCTRCWPAPTSTPWRAWRAPSSACAQGHDLVVCEGLGEIWQGRFLRGQRRRRRGPPRPRRDPRGRASPAPACSTTSATSRTASRTPCWAPSSTWCPSRASPWCAASTPASSPNRTSPTYGVLPASQRLAAVTVAEIVAALGATYVCGEEHGDAMAETYLIGAMSPEHALRYFQNARQQGGRGRRRPRRDHPRGARDAHRGDRAHRQLRAQPRRAGARRRARRAASSRSRPTPSRRPTASGACSAASACTTSARSSSSPTRSPTNVDLDRLVADLSR